MSKVAKKKRGRPPREKTEPVPLPDDVPRYKNGKRRDLPVHARKIDVARALELRIKGNSLQDIANVFGVHKTAVHKAMQRYGNIIERIPEASVMQSAAIRIREVIDTELTRIMIDKAKMEKASLNNVAYARHQNFEELRLLRGESTQNISSISRLVMAAHKPPNKLPEGSTATTTDVSPSTKGRVPDED